MARIGIFGGSFSPVHDGHLWLARQAREELGLERVIFVPSNQTPLKEKRPLYSTSARIRLLKQALQPFSYFSLSLCEVQRKGVSYTVDTLKYFRKKSAKNDMLFFLSGSDVLTQLPRWKQVSDVMRLCRFVVMARPGYPWTKSPYPVIRLISAAPDISSTRDQKKLERERLKSKLAQK